MYIEKIIEQKLKGEIIEDKKDAGGFWDYAGEIVSNYESALTQAGAEELQEEIYGALERIYFYLK